MLLFRDVCHCFEESDTAIIALLLNLGIMTDLENSIVNFKLHFIKLSNKLVVISVSGSMAKKICITGQNCMLIMKSVFRLENAKLL